MAGTKLEAIRSGRLRYSEYRLITEVVPKRRWAGRIRVVSHRPVLALPHRRLAGVHSGVTVSGGEPTYQPDFPLEFLRRCRECGIDTALDTCGYVSWKTLESILEYVDLVLFDIKHMDPVRHKELTGVDNKLILDNAIRIARKGTAMIIRVPLIPGYSDSIGNIKALGKFMSEIGLTRVDLLPYHQLGENKYKRLNMEYQLTAVKPYEDRQVQAIQEILESYELNVLIG